MSKHVDNAMEKYAKLRDDLSVALRVGMNAEKDVEDDGEINFDAPSLCLQGWLGNEIRQAAKDAGTYAIDNRYRNFRTWIFPPVSEGKAHKRTVNAVAMCNELKRRGYLASVEHTKD